MQSVKKGVRKGVAWRIPWSDDWDRVDALAYLYCPPETIGTQENLRQRLRVVVGEAFEGRHARLREDEHLSGSAPQVIAAASLIKERMTRLNLDEAATLPPVLWLRLASQFSDGLGVSVVASFSRWRTREQAHDLLLYQYEDPSGKFTGPNVRLGEGRSVAGFTTEEMLLAASATPVGWPYQLTWQRIRVEPTVRAGGVDASPQSSQQVDHVSPPTDAAKKIRPQKRKKRISVDDLKRKCGSHVVTTLEKVLTREVERRDSLLTEDGRNGRPFGCAESLITLVERLQKRYGDIRDLGPTNLKKAVAHFVSCPRGRPQGLIVSPPPLLAGPKKPR